MLYLSTKNEMNKFVITLLACFVMSVINAQTIHWLTLTDTEDPNIGKLNKTGNKILHERFINAVNSVLLETGYKADIHYINGGTLSPEECISKVLDFKCETNDIVVFYYIGHGLHIETDSTQLPSMIFSIKSVPKYVPLNWLHEKLKAKGARLLVTIGDCSNIQMRSFVEDLTLSIKDDDISSIKEEYEDVLPEPPMPPKPPTRQAHIELTNAQRTSIQNLFLACKGNIIISSASLGQDSFGGRTSFGNMDFFTAAFVAAFEDSANDDGTKWNDLLNKTKKTVEEFTEGKQIPLWISTLSPITVTKSVPTGLQEQAREIQKLYNYLAIIGDKSRDLEHRKGYVDKALHLFVNNGDSFEVNGAIREGATIGILSKNKLVKKRIKEYLNGLMNLRYMPVLITDVTCAVVNKENIVKVAEGKYIATCYVDNAFCGFRDGYPMYKDITRREIKFQVNIEQIDELPLVFIVDVTATNIMK